mmetsp:Transcript_7181/g.13313  ORF Transcript_7181/g.13313 Transcript_7181/m.13313 type:complete len:543 (+) Transcript_7181:163-1791(+)|eukprot:CAMPEP_0197536702 /NCGR_PEP_ID=MMETSP1318-20131121/54593_1 /TAXON_ID=552666 /ORGANISM="Partenskyella glossopodia, Strain RCC365" /LENGTH=542 /DNA_ID=CAMNT_0043094663 /DNA_START=140 /DNA_END=1768 /DNA_ORIENTATION=-
MGDYEPVRMGISLNGEGELERRTESSMLLRICTLEGIAAFGDRLWLFAIPMLFAEIWSGSFLAVGLYNLILYAALIVIMPISGWLIDRISRMRLMALAIVVDNVFVCLACMLTFSTSFFIGDDETLWWILGGTTACSIVAQFFANTSTIALEKDWMPVIVGEEKSALSRFNSWLRRIDLACKFIAPMIFAILLQKITAHRPTRIRIGSSFVLVWNAISMLPEILLSYSVYANSPQLSVRDRSSQSKNESEKQEDTKFAMDGDDMIRDIEDHFNSRQQGCCSRLASCCAKWPIIGPLCEGWGEWMKSDITSISLGYTLLYASVLAPGPLLTAYLKTIGLPDIVIGLSMGLGAVFGLIGTVIFEPLSRCASLPRIGLATIWLWCIFLAPTLVVFLPTSSKSTNTSLDSLLDVSAVVKGYILLSTVTVGRIWLWAFDLAETQILQQYVDQDRRGRVAATQSSIATLWTLVIYGLSVVYHKPEQFNYLVFFSFGFVFMGAVFTSFWTCCASDPSAKSDEDYMNLQVQFLEMNENTEEVLDDDELFS